MKCPRHTTLCPAGHLPLKGGDQAVDGFLPIATGLRSVQPACQPFSPLEGEMSGRTEGGNCANGRNQPHPLCRMRTNVKRPLLPASGEKVRMRGERHQWPGYRQRWKSSQGAARPSSPCRDLLPADGEKEAVIPGLTRDPLEERASAGSGPHLRTTSRTLCGHRPRLSMGPGSRSARPG